MDVQLVDWVRAHWARVEGLSVLLVLSGSGAIALIAALDLETPAAGALLLSSVLFTAAGWALARRVPRTKRGKIGFAVAINCDAIHRPAVRNDFVIALRREIRNGVCGETFQFMEIPEHTSCKVFDDKDARKLREKCRAHFLLAGRVRRRKIRGEERDVINIIGVVSHAPMPDPAAKKVAQEFNELLPTQYFIRPEESFPALEFTAEWAALVAKYMIGIAAAASRDLEYACDLFMQVRQRLATRDTGFLIYAKMMQRLPVHIATIAVIKAQDRLAKWYETKDEQWLPQVEEMLEEAASYNAGSNAYHVITAVHTFLTSRNTTQARKALSKIPRDRRDAVWHLNAAFLHAYEGNLKKTTQHYREAAKLPMPVANFDIVAQVEDFLCWAIHTFPERTQLNYCLGFLNWQFKGDPEQAVKDFTTFMARAEAPQFEDQKKLVQEWLNEIAAHEKIHEDAS